MTTHAGASTAISVAGSARKIIMQQAIDALADGFARRQQAKLQGGAPFSGGRGKGGKGGAGKGGLKGGGRGGGKGASGPNPAQLTANIKRAQTLDGLFQTISKSQSHLNHIHLSACWNSLGHLMRDADHHGSSETHAVALESLVQHTTQVVSTSSEIRARELANIAHGVAKCGRGGEMGELMTALARAIEARIGDCNAQELANIA